MKVKLIYMRRESGPLRIWDQITTTHYLRWNSFIPLNHTQNDLKLVLQWYLLILRSCYSPRAVVKSLMYVWIKFPLKKGEKGSRSWQQHSPPCHWIRCFGPHCSVPASERAPVLWSLLNTWGSNSNFASLLLGPLGTFAQKTLTLVILSVLQQHRCAQLSLGRLTQGDHISNLFANKCVMGGRIFLSHVEESPVK